MWPLLHWEDYLQGFGIPAVISTSRGSCRLETQATDFGPGQESKSAGTV